MCMDFLDIVFNSTLGWTFHGAFAFLEAVEGREGRKGRGGRVTIIVTFFN